MNKCFKFFRKINIWFAVHINDWPVYRVTYKNGEKTYPLHYAEAKGCRDVFGGNLWVDWEYAEKLIYYH